MRIHTQNMEGAGDLAPTTPKLLNPAQSAPSEDMSAGDQPEEQVNSLTDNILANKEEVPTEPDHSTHEPGVDTSNVVVAEPDNDDAETDQEASEPETDNGSLGDDP